MLFIKKKNVNYIIIVISILTIFSLGYKIINVKNKINTTEIVSLPVSGKTIVLDAGHGYPDQRS